MHIRNISFLISHLFKLILVILINKMRKAHFFVRNIERAYIILLFDLKIRGHSLFVWVQLLKQLLSLIDSLLYGLDAVHPQNFAICIWWCMKRLSLRAILFTYILCFPSLRLIFQDQARKFAGYILIKILIKILKLDTFTCINLDRVFAFFWHFLPIFMT